MGRAELFFAILHTHLVSCLATSREVNENYPIFDCKRNKNGINLLINFLSLKYKNHSRNHRTIFTHVQPRIPILCDNRMHSIPTDSKYQNIASDEKREKGRKNFIPFHILPSLAQDRWCHLVTKPWNCSQAESIFSLVASPREQSEEKLSEFQLVSSN